MSHNYISLLSLISSVKKQIKKNNLNSALKLIHGAVMQVITEPVCTAQVFMSKALDDLCGNIGTSCFQNNLLLPEQVRLGGLNQPVFIYLVTKLQRSGGHTRVIRDFIMARSEAVHLVISTELDGSSDRSFLMETIPSSIKLIEKYAPKGTFEQKLTWLQTQLATYSAQKVYLFNHHQDSVIISAVQGIESLKLSFYHHGDYHLCLGASLIDCEHIDIHAVGFHQCRSRGINNIYIPLVVTDKGSRLPERTFKADGYLTTCTAARSNKIEKPYFIKYTEVIPEMLANTRGKHIHIGSLSLWARWQIRQKLRQKGVSSRQFVYIPWVADVWRTLQGLNVDLYIASFPYAGGLTQIEAMGAGIPIATHRHMYSRILSGIDMAYPDVFSWHLPDELINYCMTVSVAELNKHSLRGRDHYNKHYKNDNLVRILNNQIEVSPPQLWDHYQPQYDELAYWVSGQFTFCHIFYHRIYRLAKKMRYWVSQLL